MLERAVSNPKREMQEKGEARTLVAPRPFLAGASDYGDLVTVADELGISETAVGAIFHRMRKRMCELVKTEVEQTLEPGGNVAEELRNLPGAPKPRSVKSDCALLNDVRRFRPHRDRLQVERRARTVKRVDSWKDAFTFRRFRAGLSLPRFLSQVSPMSLLR